MTEAQTKVAVATLAPPPANWRSRLIRSDRLAADDCPSWLDGCYDIFRANVMHPNYPCFFGTQAERKGEMFYTAIPAGEPEALASSLATFVHLGQQPRYHRYNLAAFYEPVNLPADHEALRQWFWRELQMLHRHDSYHDHHGPFLQPDHPDWEFCYQGCQMFVVVCSPTYKRRHSRRMGPGIVLLFQPRAVFIDTVTNVEIAHSVRTRIRSRLAAWDGMETPPDLGLYGDPSNREWKQYCLPDDEGPVPGTCPFLTRMPRPA